MSLAKLPTLPVSELRIGNFVVCVKNRLAEGGFSYVDLVYEANSKIEYVLKRSGIERAEIYDIVKKEINILQSYAGPHLVKLLASDVIMVSKGKREACLLLELCPGGHLLDRLNSREGKHLPPASLYRIFGQLLLALKPMHESDPPVTHRDLKLENILFGTDGNVRLCDFGSCVAGPVPIRNADERAAAEEIIGKETTQMYRAPEMIDLYMRDVLTEKTDIWALGCILYTLCFLLHPFQDAGSLGILSAKIKFPDAPVAPEVKVVLMRMLDVDPEARPSISQLLAAFAAMATGKPLPHYEIPAEAIERRKEREITAKKREEKNKSSKKVVPKVTPLKPSGPLDSNSVAARRLAMKKGIDPSGGHSAHPAPHVAHEADSRNSDNATESLFDADFGSHTATGVPTASASTSATASAGAAVLKSLSKESNGWDLDHRPASSEAFSDPWGAQGTSSYDNPDTGSQHFDAFGDGIGLKPVTAPSVLPISKTPSRSSQTASLLDWSEPDKSASVSLRSSHETLCSVNSAAAPTVFAAAHSSTDSEMGFSAFGNSPKNPHSAPFGFDSSSSSLFPSAPAVSSRPVSARQPSHQERSLDFLSDTTPHQYPTMHSERATPVQTPAKGTRLLPSTPSPAARGVSEPVSMPSYEVDLFDTTPGPPVIDFLSLDSTPSYRATTSSYVSRQQANDVLSLFDNAGAPLTPMRSACPDLTKSLQSNSAGGFMMNGQGMNSMSNQLKLQQQQILQQQQQQQQQQGSQRPLSFPMQSQQRLPQENTAQRPLSNNYTNSPVATGQGAAGRGTQR